MRLIDIHARIKASKYKSWQVYVLAIAILAIIGLYLDVRAVYSAFQTVESVTASFDWLVILGIQGVVIGFVAELLYDQGDRYAKSASHLFGSKDRTLLFRIGVMTIVSGVVTKVVPQVVDTSTQYPVIQTVGAVLSLGILLVHTGSSDWKASTEWPAITAGLLLAAGPSLI